MNLLKKAPLALLVGIVMALFGSNTVRAEPLRIGYSDWPGFTILEVAKQKKWFNQAGIDVDLVWFDYLPSLDAFAAGKVDAVTVVATDALVNGAKSKIIAILDYSDGSDMILGKAGIESIKDLKGQKVGIEATLVDHLLLLEALKQNGMSQADVEIVNTATNETPQTLASGKVAAVGAWYPVSSQALKQVPGSKKLFTSADAKGLIYDVLAVNPVSFAQRKEDWTKVVQIFYKCVDYINDPATREDAIKIMAARAGADPDEYEKNVPGNHFLSLPEAKAAFKKGAVFDSIYGSMAIGNQFNLENKVYKDSQNPSSYLVPSIVEGL